MLDTDGLRSLAARSSSGRLDTAGDCHSIACKSLCIGVGVCLVLWFCCERWIIRWLHQGLSNLAAPSVGDIHKGLGTLQADLTQLGSSRVDGLIQQVNASLCMY
jgi:hypothetical protein